MKSGFYFALCFICCVVVSYQAKISYRRIPESTCPPPPACAAPPIGCRAKAIRDAKGCLIGCSYDCKCPQRFCQFCPGGYVQDEDGCDTCKCKVECGPLPPCAAPPPGCRANLVRDDNGCIVGCSYDCSGCDGLNCFQP